MQQATNYMAIDSNVRFNHSPAFNVFFFNFYSSLKKKAIKSMFLTSYHISVSLSFSSRKWASQIAFIHFQDEGRSRNWKWGDIKCQQQRTQWRRRGLKQQRKEFWAVSCEVVKKGKLRCMCDNTSEEVIGKAEIKRSPSIVQLVRDTKHPPRRTRLREFKSFI